MDEEEVWRGKVSEDESSGGGKTTHARYGVRAPVAGCPSCPSTERAALAVRRTSKRVELEGLFPHLHPLSLWKALLTLQ